MIEFHAERAVLIGDIEALLRLMRDLDHPETRLMNIRIFNERIRAAVNAHVPLSDIARAAGMSQRAVLSHARQADKNDARYAKLRAARIKGGL